MALTNSQVFLNEPTIEAAREKYLTRWHLQSVKDAWNGRKPTIAQFKKKFGPAYAKRQAWLARTGQGTSATALAVVEREDVAQAVAEAVAAALSATEEVEDEPEVENLGVDVDETIQKVLALLNKQGDTQAVEADSTEDAPKFVKPENFNELPRSGQVYFFLHRAVEAGQSYAIVPVKRGVAAEAISQIKDDGRDYGTVASALVKA